MDYGIGVALTLVFLILSLFFAATSYLARMHMVGQTTKMRQKNENWSVFACVMSFVFTTAFIAFGVWNWQELSQLFLNH